MRSLQGYGYDHVWQVDDDHLNNQDRYTRFLQDIGKLTLFQDMTRKRAWDAGALQPDEFDDGYIGETAVRFIEAYEGDAPLYLQVGFLGPHPPYWAPGSYATMYDPDKMQPPLAVDDPRADRAGPACAAQYLGRISLIDHYVGRLCAALEAKGMLENTLILFTADHGDLIGDYGIFDKRYFYQPSVCVPLLMAGPGLELNARLGGRVCRELVSGVDLYPTFLHAAGCENRLGAQRRDGLSLLDMANDRGPCRPAVYSELGTMMMVRDANWKLVYDAEQGGVQYLFNLRRDPQELDNLAGVAGYESIEKHYVELLLYVADPPDPSHPREGARALAARAHIGGRVGPSRYHCRLRDSQRALRRSALRGRYPGRQLAMRAHHRPFHGKPARAARRGHDQQGQGTELV